MKGREYDVGASVSSRRASVYGLANYDASRSCSFAAGEGGGVEGHLSPNGEVGLAPAIRRRMLSSLGVRHGESSTFLHQTRVLTELMRPGSSMGCLKLDLNGPRASSDVMKRPGGSRPIVLPVSGCTRQPDTSAALSNSCV